MGRDIQNAESRQMLCLHGECGSATLLWLEKFQGLVLSPKECEWFCLCA